MIPALQCQPSLSRPQWIQMKITLNFSPSLHCQKIFEQPSPCDTVVTNYTRRRLGRRVVGFSPPPPMEDEQFEHMFEVVRLSEIPTDPSRRRRQLRRHRVGQRGIRVAQAPRQRGRRSSLRCICCTSVFLNPSKRQQADAKCIPLPVACMERHYADIAVIDHAVDPLLSLPGTSFGRDVRLIRAGSVEQEGGREGGWLIYKCLRGRGGTRE